VDVKKAVVVDFVIERQEQACEMTELAFPLKHDGFGTGVGLFRFSFGATVTSGKTVEDVVTVLASC
jgi:hypothetical protein